MSGTKQLEMYFAAVSEVVREEPRRSLEIISKLLLGRWRHNFGPKTFFLYDLHNRPISSWSNYLPYDANVAKILSIVNRRYEHFRVTVDKLLTAELLEEGNVPVPPALAVVGRDLSKHPVCSDVAVLQTTKEIEAYLRSVSCADQLFSKPVAGESGAGAFLAKRDNDCWGVKGRLLTTEEFAVFLLEQATGRFGRLLQARLVNHPDICAMTGSTGLSTLRIVVAREFGHPRHIFAVQKLIGDDSDTDNFNAGSGSVLLAAVDLAQGRLRAGFGRQAGNDFLMQSFRTHPISGSLIEGAVLPDWDEVLDITRRTCDLFIHQPLLGFDLAFTDKGPMVLEANTTWSWAIPQTAMQQGGKSMLLGILDKLGLTDEECADVRGLVEEF